MIDPLCTYLPTLLFLFLRPCSESFNEGYLVVVGLKAPSIEVDRDGARIRLKYFCGMGKGKGALSWVCASFLFIGHMGW